MQSEMKYMGLEEEQTDDLSKITDESTLHEGKKFWSKTPLFRILNPCCQGIDKLHLRSFMIPASLFYEVNDPLLQIWYKP